jgi:hypothetical protein
MSKLSNQQTDFIIDKININKNLSPELKDDLIDHFCCTIENEMDKGKDFETAFQIACNRISPDGIEELGNEMMFLMNSKSKKRLSKMLRISGFSAITGIFISTFLKVLHLPFGGLAVLITALIILFLFLPSLFTHFFKNSTKKNKWMYITGFLGIFFMLASLTCFIFHWPFSRIFLATGIVLIYITIFPLFFHKIYKKKTVN